MGFDDRARPELDSIERAWRREAALDLVLVGIGDIDDFGGGGSRAGRCPLLVTLRAGVFVPEE
jgi:hypothetical protein